MRDSPQLSATARTLFSDPHHTVYLSAVSVWEIAVKHGLGRLPLAEPPHHYIPHERAKHGIAALDLTEAAVLKIRRLPPHHHDPY